MFNCSLVFTFCIVSVIFSLFVVGGAISMYMSTTVISQSRFERNRVRWGGALGGAIRIISSNLFCSDSVFSYNKYVNIDAILSNLAV